MLVIGRSATPRPTRRSRWPVGGTRSRPWWTWVADRVTLAGQSFFDPLPAGADLYLLRNVLNDWPDEQTRQILRRCAEAARRDGRVVVLGGVVPDGSAPELTIEKVLLGSRNNSLAEFQDLAGAAGLTVHAVSEQPSGRFLVECRTA